MTWRQFFVRSFGSALAVLLILAPFGELRWGTVAFLFTTGFVITFVRDLRAIRRHYYHAGT